jgi:TRAP-type uncharacterized transport system fused permease subunit
MTLGWRGRLNRNSKSSGRDEKGDWLALLARAITILCGCVFLIAAVNSYVKNPADPRLSFVLAIAGCFIVIVGFVASNRLIQRLF